MLNQSKKDLITSREYRKACKCIGCGVCCKFAVSEFSPEELKQKAQNGDNFANQFLSIFVKYENEEEVNKIFPEYIELLKKYTDGKFYIYHCPKVTSENKCPDYENRPQICRDFPDNPIAFIPPNCGYKNWKTEAEPYFLRVNALIEIVKYYKQNLTL